ncbi:hypothetical protein [Kibdelosporangium phytohabitans]|uniref:TROVE domain-containing protein n=1 Tax=Kibdelosporangium phytohabitans TaxID=860235 RepID=A0A0N9HXZ1_9PSEU|nr:hypothetical protein [Kibdelosporangium phytohabitans]ALG10286.1 hypothetical protein AOZ06_28350 [Kibdelosporangium phytohabitans]MBE1461316.1 hypothetical protein [Kibdelosporangium phytohabitans]
MLELVAATMSMIGYRDAYFLWSEPVRDRFRTLVRAATRQDPDWTAAFLGWLRGSTSMRYPALVGAAHFVAERTAGGQNGMSRQVVGSVLRNADDPGRLLGYWIGMYGPRVPKPVKRGIADAVERMAAGPPVADFDATVPAFLAARRDTKRLQPPLPLRLRDVIALTHPKARTVSTQPRWVMPGRRRLQDLGPAEWDRRTADMSLPQLLANLRRFDWAGIPFRTAMAVAERISDREEVQASGVRPMRFIAAQRAVGHRRWPLADGAGHSTAALPRIPGRTLIVIDQYDYEDVAYGLTLAHLCSTPTCTPVTASRSR